MKTTITGTVGYDKAGQPISVTNITVEGDGVLSKDTPEATADEFIKVKAKIKSKEVKD